MENRQKDRHDYNKTILCFECKNTGDTDVKVPFLITVNDISYGGMGITCKQYIPKDAIIKFQFAESDDNRAFEIEICWTKYDDGEYKMGTKFINMVKDDVIFLFNMISKM